MNQTSVAPTETSVKPRWTADEFVLRRDDYYFALGEIRAIMRELLPRVQDRRAFAGTVTRIRASLDRADRAISRAVAR